MTRRMVMAVLALVGLFVSSYSTMYHYGVIGELTCNVVHGCEVVQNSRWSMLVGFPVALWGAAYYTSLLVLILASLQARWSASRPLAAVVAVLGVWGALFSGWLTYVEVFRIRDLCMWCLISAASAIGLCVLGLLDWKAGRSVQA